MAAEPSLLLLDFQLAGVNLVNGDGDGLAVKGFALFLGLLRDLPGAAGYEIHKQIAAADFVDEVGHGGIEHHDISTSVTRFSLSAALHFSAVSIALTSLAAASGSSFMTI